MEFNTNHFSSELISETIECNNIPLARTLLQHVAFSRGITPPEIFRCCRDLLAIDSHADTVSAIAYALWEVGIPPDPVPSSEFVDYLLSLTTICHRVTVVNYVLMTIGDCIGCGYLLSPQQTKMIRSLERLDVPPQLQQLIDTLLGLQGR